MGRVKAILFDHFRVNVSIFSANHRFKVRDDLYFIRGFIDQEAPVLKQDLLGEAGICVSVNSFDFHNRPIRFYVHVYSS